MILTKPEQSRYTVSAIHSPWCPESPCSCLLQGHVLQGDVEFLFLPLIPKRGAAHSVLYSTVSPSFVQYPTSTLWRCWHFQCLLGYFGVSIIHCARTWTTGSLTCASDLFACRYTLGTLVYSLIRGPGRKTREDLGQGNQMTDQRFPASAIHSLPSLTNPSPWTNPFLMYPLQPPPPPPPIYNIFLLYF